MKIEHIAIWAEDLELMRQFYTRYFNLACSEKYENPKKGYSSFFLSFGKDKTRIELMNIVDMPQASECSPYLKGLAHFAISVGGKTAVNALTERLREDGYTIAGEPRTTGDGYYESAVLDPEGNLLEICE